MLSKRFWIYIAIAIAATLTQVVKATDLMTAIAIVESNRNDAAVGDKGKAVGSYQLWKAYVDDVNRICKRSGSSLRFTYKDRTDRVKSAQMVKIYLYYYGKRYQRITGKKPTSEVYARIHNGGPNGWKKPATIKYWNKIKKEMVK